MLYYLSNCTQLQFIRLVGSFLFQLCRQFNIRGHCQKEKKKRIEKCEGFLYPIRRAKSQQKRSNKYQKQACSPGLPVISDNGPTIAKRVPKFKHSNKTFFSSSLSYGHNEFNCKSFPWPRTISMIKQFLQQTSRGKYIKEHQQNQDPRQNN